MAEGAWTDGRGALMADVKGYRNSLTVTFSYNSS